MANNRVQNVFSDLTELGHSTAETLSRSHTMSKKNVPQHNNVKYAYGVPFDF